MHRYPFLATLTLGCLTFLCGNIQAIIVDDYTPATNDRFANNPSFIAAGFDLSGIAINNNGRWLTMISPNVFLSAYHFAPANGSSVTFYASNDPLGDSLTRTVSTNTQRIGSSDIWIGTLSEPLTAAYTYYDFATEPLTNNNTAPGGPGAANSESFINSPYFESEAYLIGRSPGSYSVSQDMVVGKNIIDGFLPSVEVEGTTDRALTTRINDSGDTNYVTYETEFASGDSGAGMFVEQAGSITLVGINWFVGTVGGNPVNGFSYLGNYATEINEFLGSHSIPEPATTILIIGLAATLFARRRKAI